MGNEKGRPPSRKAAHRVSRSETKLSGCTPACEVRERWFGATLYSRQFVHHHGQRVNSSYDYATGRAA
jgi:hypothetical protein